MDEKLKKIKIIKNLINIFYYIFILLVEFYVVKTLQDQLIFSVIIFVFLFNYVYFFSVFFHEIGHLIFGIKAKLKFIAFNVLGYTFFIENNKLKIKKKAKIPGALGYCDMIAEENKKYNKNSIILYYMGGIIFNLIFAIISIILLFLTNNIYLKLIHILNIGNNIILVLNNCIPSIIKLGNSNDALHVVYSLEDEEYINKISKVRRISNSLENGNKLKDIDSKLLIMPQQFKTNADVLIATLYIDCLIEKKQYQEASNYAQKMLEKEKSLLSKQNIITLKLQIINCVLSCSDDIEKINEFWDKDVKKYLDSMSKFIPIYIGFNYMYATLVEKNESNSKKYLNQFQKLNKQKYNKNQLQETEEFINYINKKSKKIN